MKNKTIEEYIEVIHNLEKKHGHVHTNDLAANLGVSPPSATEMVQKLSKKKLVNYVPYRGVTLTKDGEKIAKELIKTHKTLAEFLEIIGVNKKNAEKDACQIEHHVSAQTVKQLNRFVEFVREAPVDPIWLGHFKHYCKTGERLICEKA
ncbi:MAG: metal-dependent transcriptional regulator [Thermoplasmata archaeon]|nr:MAG: metal-dependent transcriptional regulator [Thermoplasmata archaeon]